MLIKNTLAIGKAEISYWLSRADNASNTLIMLHGVASNHTRWSEFATDTSLKRDWNLLSVDLRGHGDSMYYGNINRRVWVNDLKAIIEHEQLAPVVLLGHSLGAEIALDYINCYGDDVQRLMMIDPVFPDTLQGKLAVVKRFKYLVRITTWLIQFLNLLGIRRRHLTKRDLQLLDNKTRDVLQQNPDVNISDLYMNPFADLSYIPIANYLQDQYEVVRPLPPLEPMSLPVLVILSSGSSVSDRCGNEAQIKRMPNADIEWVECNHWPLTEQPEVVRKIIDKWCRNA